MIDTRIVPLASMTSAAEGSTHVYFERVDFIPVDDNGHRDHLGVVHLWIDGVCVGQSFVDLSHDKSSNVYTTINGLPFADWEAQRDADVAGTMHPDNDWLPFCDELIPF